MVRAANLSAKVGLLFDSRFGCQRNKYGRVQLLKRE